MQSGIILTALCFSEEVGLTRHTQALRLHAVWTQIILNTEMLLTVRRDRAELSIIPIITATVLPVAVIPVMFVRDLFVPTAVANVWAET